MRCGSAPDGGVDSASARRRSLMSITEATTNRPSVVRIGLRPTSTGTSLPSLRRPNTSRPAPSPSPWGRPRTACDPRGGGGESIGEQRLDGQPDELLARVAEDRLDQVVDEDDPALSSTMIMALGAASKTCRNLSSARARSVTPGTTRYSRRTRRGRRTAEHRGPRPADPRRRGGAADTGARTAAGRRTRVRKPRDIPADRRDGRRRSIRSHLLARARPVKSSQDLLKNVRRLSTPDIQMRIGAESATVRKRDSPSRNARSARRRRARFSAR